MGEKTIIRRRRVKQTSSLNERLSQYANKAKQLARTMPPSKNRDILLRTVREAELAAQLENWLKTPGSLPPE